MSDERGKFDEGFDVTEDDFKTAVEPPKPWPDGPANALVKEFVLSPEPGPSGFRYYSASIELTRADGKKKDVRDSLSTSPAAKGKFVQFCACFGLGLRSEVNQVRRGELSPVGLTGLVTVGHEDGTDGNMYNRVKRYITPKG